MNYIGLVADIIETILKLVLAIVPGLASNSIILELDKIIKVLQAV